MLTEAQVISEWARRRQATWRAIRWPLGTCVASGSAFWFLSKTPVPDMSGTQLLLTFALLLVLFVGVVIIIYRTRSLYRCPRCDSLPEGAWYELGPTSFGFQSGIDVNPTRCPKCGVALRRVDDA
jgi:hypothetical protein